MAHSTIPNSPTEGRPLPGINPYVVVIFGRTGVGISSLVNLIIGHPVSNEHPDAMVCADHIRPHAPVTFRGSKKQFCLYEAPGFHGRFPHKSILRAIRQLDQSKGIDLFIYCLRKQKSTVMPRIVRDIRNVVVGRDVPMIAVVTELERFEPSRMMEDWWGALPGNSQTDVNGALIERMCFGEYGAFSAHACVTTLPCKDVDLVQTLRKRRDVSEERIRQLILEQCEGHKRRGEWQGKVLASAY